MKVSIITPAYNCEKFIEACILSVKNQDYKDIEHIIINDGSTDSTETIIRKHLGTYNVRLLSQENMGITKTMNNGFAKASGEIFAWLDADNYYKPDAIRTVLDIFTKNPNVDVVYGNILFEYYQSKKTAIYRPPNTIDFNKALIRTTGAIPLQPAVFFTKKLFDATGGFDSRFKIAGDYDFWMKAMKLCPKIVYCNKVFGIYTIMPSGISQSTKGIIYSLREVRSICRRYNQPLYAIIYTYFKYLKGCLGNVLRGIQKK